MKRFTDTDKWRDSWFQALKPESKLALLYIYDNCDAAGVFDPNLRLADFCLGQNVDWAAFKCEMADRMNVLANGKWHLTRFIDFQYGTLSPDCKPHQNILRLLKGHNLMHTLSKGYPKGQGKGKGNGKGNDKEEEEAKRRVCGLFNKRPETPWDRSEVKAWEHAALLVEATSNEEWTVLEAYYKADLPKDKDYRRRNLATMLNNFSGEVSRAKEWQSTRGQFDDRF